MASEDVCLFGAIAGLIGIGTIAQINGITSAAETFFDPNKVNTITLLVMNIHGQLFSRVL